MTAQGFSYVGLAGGSFNTGYGSVDSGKAKTNAFIELEIADARCAFDSVPSSYVAMEG
jgi:hypothetical protein